jgi:hypothetical protein
MGKTRIWQALLVAVLLWAQIAAANHLHPLDVDTGNGDRVTECLSCQQLNQDNTGIRQQSFVLFFGSGQYNPISHYTPYCSPQQNRASIRAPPAQQ